jgi:hypothetical protein
MIMYDEYNNSVQKKFRSYIKPSRGNWKMQQNKDKYLKIKTAWQLLYFGACMVVQTGSSNKRTSAGLQTAEMECLHKVKDRTKIG